ncbi:MAG TPA: spore coat protein CotJB [Ruminiclostridium sp.]
MNMSMMSEREMLMWKMQASDFAMEEVGLFLDVHPNDPTALSYFKQYREMKKQAESDFTRKYGPVTIDNYDNNLPTWGWIENPWPWENGNEV